MSNGRNSFSQMFDPWRAAWSRRREEKRERRPQPMPKHAPPTATKRINLALQGGGAHGAFTWGVLDYILEDGRLAIDGISGASAGAMNAVMLADGLAIPVPLEHQPDARPQTAAERLDANDLFDAWHRQMFEAMNAAIRDVAREHLNGRAITEPLLNHIEVAIRAYDPCLSCATHALGSMPLEVSLIDADGALIERLHAQGWRALVYTVNDAAVAHVLRASGCSVLLHGHTGRDGEHHHHGTDDHGPASAGGTPHGAHANPARASR